jgi:hypothetical protein
MGEDIEKYINKNKEKQKEQDKKNKLPRVYKIKPSDLNVVSFNLVEPQSKAVKFDIKKDIKK